MQNGSKLVRFNSVEVTNRNYKNDESKASTPLLPAISELQSNKSVTISIFSKHKLPKKGHTTLQEKIKAYSTLIGGILWMLVSYLNS